MKNFVQRTLLFVLLLMTFAAEGAMAQFSTGNVVHFTNRASGKAMAATSSNGVAGVTPDKSDYLQLWYVETGGTTVVLRNLGNGRYLQGNSDSSTQWQTVTSKGSYPGPNDTNGDTKKDVFTTSLLLCSNSSYFTLAAETTSWLDYDYDKLHYESLTGKCVSWLGGSEVSKNTWDILPASWWTVETVGGINVNDRWNQINNFNSIVSKQSEYQGYLNTLFADVLCTQLKPAYDTQGELTTSSAYQNLPAELKELALKVCNNDWSEKNRNNQEVTWSSKAGKRFRVQSYEPHSVAEEISSVVKTSSYSNMNNPTGIYADNMEVLYVIVGSNPANGASLSITSLADDSEDYLTSLSATSKTTLTQGLNIIPVYGKGSLQYILYAVNSQSASFPLTNFPDIQINIAGGSINGLYELGKDSGIYTELKTNAEKNGRTYYDVLSNRFAFRTSVATVFKGGRDNSLQRALKMWDKVMLSQHYIMGVKAGRYEEDPLGLHTQKIDYSKQFNNRLLVHSKASIGAYTQMPFRIQFAHGESYLVGDAMETTNQIWVPAHETGHTNQLLINMIGTTEITNNLFSNVAMFYQDYLKTRGGTIADNNAEHLKGTAWHFRDANNRMRMFYQLWLYYHAAGRNKNFFPELYRLLRNDPMSYHDTYGNSNTNYTSTEALKFYKYACQAAGEDLTPFFEAWGFFIPFGQTTITDYYDYKITSTQEHINAAKNEVAGYGYAKNHAILFVEDRVGDVKSAGGVLKQWSQEELAVGDRGQYTDYKNGSDPSGEYTWTISQGNRVIVFSESGKGAGYVIVDGSGNIKAFSNADNFEVNDNIVSGLKSGSYTLRVYGTTVGTYSNAVNVENSNSPAAQKVALGVLLENIKAVLEITDATNSKIGYYKSSYATGLQNAYNESKAVYDDPNPNGTAYYTQIRKLNNEYDLLMEKGDYAKVGVVNGSTYKLVNSGQFEDKNQVKVELSMAYNNKDVDGIKTVNSDTQRWIFEATGNSGYYYIKNKSSQFYIGKMTANSQQVRVETSNTAQAGTYKVLVKAPGLVAIVDENNRALHVDASHNVVGWNDGATNSQWYMTAVELSSLGQTKDELDALIGETTWAINEMAYATISSTPVVSGIKSEYASVTVGGATLNTNNVAKACQAVAAAQVVSNKLNATAAEMEAAHESLLEHYYYLMSYYNTKNGVNLSAEKAALQTAINNVQGYLNNMGGSGEEKVTLTATAGQPGYVSSNAEHNAGRGTTSKDGDGIPALLDSSTSTYFHSRWGGNAVNEPHYIQVDLGAGNELSDFKFNYKTRTDNNNGTHAIPTEIVVSGSNDGVNFTPLKTLNKELPGGKFTAPTADYSLNSNYATASKTNTDRYINTITLASPKYGTQTSASLTNDTKAKMYKDLTTTTIFKAAPGETLTASFNAAHHWMGGYVYIDEENNGFTAGVTNTYVPTGDLKTYSFYSGNDNSDSYGYNSAGTYISGDNRNTISCPTFTAPTKPGLYRMRYKMDWNSIDPKGDTNSTNGDFAGNRGNIVDVLLEVKGSLSGMQTFNSEAISVGSYYRYLRFTVTESACYQHNNCSTKFGAYYYFGISEFGLTKIYNNTTQDTWVSDELKAEAQAEINEAQNVHDNAKTAAELVRETEEMEALLAQLKNAQQLTLPVKLTTNPNTPYLYQVGIKQVNGLENQVWQYNTTESKYESYGEARNWVSYAASSVSNTNQAFYFMKGTETGQVYIYPYTGGGKLLAANEELYNLGTYGRIPSAEKDNQDNYVQEWTFVDCGDGTFNIRPAVAGTGYYTAVAAQMPGYYYLGFVNSGAGNDARFTFAAVNPNASAAYNTLNNYVNNHPKVAGSTQLFATSAASANAYNTLYDEAKAMLETAASDDVLTDMYNRLVAAYEAITTNEPSAEKLYFIRSASSNASMKDAYIYGANDGYLRWSQTYDPATETSGIWKISKLSDGTYTFQNTASNKYINGPYATGSTPLSNSATGFSARVIENSNGQLNLVYSYTSWGTLYQYAYTLTTKNGNDCRDAFTEGVSLGEKGNAAAFYIEELANVAELKTYELNVSHWGYAGLYLDFTTVIPESLKAYVITNNEPENVTTDDGGNPVATIVLRELDGANRVLPANTGVILKATQEIPENSTMYCTFEPTDLEFDGNEDLIENNKLGGSVFETYISNKSNSLDFYIFGVKNSKIGLYRAYEHFGWNASTSQYYMIEKGYERDGLTSYMKCSANKIYLPTANGALQNASSSSRLKFRIADPDEEFVTDIESVETAVNEPKEEVIYDLQGRRIERITAPGLYIVNGQKRYVKAVKF